MKYNQCKWFFILLWILVQTFTVYAQEKHAEYFDIRGTNQIIVNSVQVPEGNPGNSSTAVLTVTIGTAPSADLVVDYQVKQVQEGGEFGIAVAGRDYLPGMGLNFGDTYNGTIIIPSGQLSADISIPITPDTIYEEDELFEVAVQNPYTGEWQSAYVLIIDDDEAPFISLIGDIRAREGNRDQTAVSVLIEMSHQPEVPVSIGYWTEDGTARSEKSEDGLFERDYEPIVDEIRHIPAPSLQHGGRENPQQVFLTNALIVGDVYYEEDEDFYLSIRPLANAQFQDGISKERIKITIENDEAPFAVELIGGEAARPASSEILISEGWCQQEDEFGNCLKFIPPASIKMTGYRTEVPIELRLYTSDAQQAAGEWYPAVVDDDYLASALDLILNVKPLYDDYQDSEWEQIDLGGGRYQYNWNWKQSIVGNNEVQNTRYYVLNAEMDGLHAKSSDLVIKPMEYDPTYAFNYFVIHKYEEPPNYPPVAEDIRVVTNKNTPITVDVLTLSNAYDPAGHKIRLNGIVWGPDNGTAIVSGEDIVYTPNQDYVGVDCLKFEICNIHNACTEANLFIDVLETDVDLKIVKEVSSANIRLNEVFEYVLTVLNKGPGIADNVIVEDVIPEELEYMSYQSESFSGRIEYGNRFIATKPQMTVGEVGTIRIKVKAVKGGIITNTAVVESDNHELYPEDNISSIDKLIFEVKIPNVFTPNGDGNNDTWEILTTNGTIIDVMVFTRWGDKVYQSINYKNDWDGSNLAEGTYFYVVNITVPDGQQYIQKGYVTIIRNNN